jgi:protein-S-isoprenylcysteine O-methyltransferase Ste14
VSTPRKASTRSPFQLLLRIPVPWVFVLTYIIGAGLEHALPLRAGNGRLPGVNVAGGVLFGIGATLAGWGLLTFRRAQTTTVPGKASSRLVSWGPYRFSRNPMYVGLIAAYLGEAGILRQVWPVILLPLTVAYVNWIVIPLEESKLREVFSEEYDRYRMRVRRWL